MKKLLANKQTDEQKQANEFARYQFIMAMMNMDEIMIGKLLKEDSTFLGCMNNWQLLYWLKNQFNKLFSHMVHSKFKEGVSLDYYPGSEIYEFLYTRIEICEHNDLLLNNELNEESVFDSNNEFSIKLVLLFENGKIADVRLPERSLDILQLKKMQNEN